jgi:hypothetical protein
VTPGTYLRKRREAAGVPIEKIAAGISTNPRWNERDRIILLQGIEGDVTPAANITLAALGNFYRFSPRIYDQLVTIHHFGGRVDPPQLCRVCACTEHDACRVDQTGWRSATGGLGCWWVEPDLCSACDGRDRASGGRWHDA